MCPVSHVHRPQVLGVPEGHLTPWQPQGPNPIYEWPQNMHAATGSDDLFAVDVQPYGFSHLQQQVPGRYPIALGNMVIAQTYESVEHEQAGQRRMLLERMDVERDAAQQREHEAHQQQIAE